MKKTGTSRPEILIRRLSDRKTRLLAGLVGLRGFGFGKQGKVVSIYRNRCFYRNWYSFCKIIVQLLHRKPIFDL